MHNGDQDDDIGCCRWSKLQRTWHLSGVRHDDYQVDISASIFIHTEHTFRQISCDFSSSFLRLIENVFVHGFSPSQVFFIFFFDLDFSIRFYSMLAPSQLTRNRAYTHSQNNSFDEIVCHKFVRTRWKFYRKDAQTKSNDLFRCEISFASKSQTQNTKCLFFFDAVFFAGEISKTFIIIQQSFDVNKHCVYRRTVCQHAIAISVTKNRYYFCLVLAQMYLVSFISMLFFLCRAQHVEISKRSLTIFHSQDEKFSNISCRKLKMSKRRTEPGRIVSQTQRCSKKTTKRLFFDLFCIRFQPNWKTLYIIWFIWREKDREKCTKTK